MNAAFAMRIMSALCWFDHIIVIKICLIDMYFFVKCGIHYFNTTKYWLLKFVLGNVP